MAQLYRLSFDQGRKRPGSGPGPRWGQRLGPPVFFNRLELNQLLSLYSRQVARGEWRDYAIDQRAGRAVFSVFRHAQAPPLFRISKKADAAGCGRLFEVTRGHEVVRAASSLADVLEIFRRTPRMPRKT